MFLEGKGLGQPQVWRPDSWRKCHKKTKNDRARFVSNLPSYRNAYKQISELSFGGISAYITVGFRPKDAERRIRSESLG